MKKVTINHSESCPRISRPRASSRLLRSMRVSKRARVSFTGGYALDFGRSPRSLFDNSAQSSGSATAASGSIFAAAGDAGSH
jgi:hypothetical protein